MSLHVRFENSVVVLSNIGRLMNDPRYTSAGQEVADLLNQGYRHFVIELRDIREAGAPFLGLLMTLTRRARQSRGEVVLAHASRSVDQCIQDMRLEEFWDRFPTIEEACAFLERPTAARDGGDRETER